MAGTVGWVEELLRRGAAVDSTDGAGWTALQHATNGGQLKAVACLLRNGAGPNVACGQGGSTPLFWAPTVEFARMLLVFGASPGLIDSEGRTAEQWHLAMGRDDVAQQIRMLQSPKLIRIAARQQRSSSSRIALSSGTAPSHRRAENMCA
jgi:ankyrin repeat protein